MDADLLAKKEKLYSAHRRYGEVMRSESTMVKDIIAAHKGIEQAKAELEGRVQGFGGFRAFLNDFIVKHPAWYPRGYQELSSGEE